VQALAVDPASSDVVYAGLDGGGVYRTTDGGATWTQSGLSDVTVASIAIDPANPSVLFAGADDGVYRSTDGGFSWTQVNGTLYITSVVIDPTNTSVAYAGSLAHGNVRGTVVKSTDGGATWSPSGNGIRANRIYALAIAPSNSSWLYAGTNSTVYRTKDGGASWKKISAGIVSGQIVFLAVDPTDNKAAFAAGYGVFKTIDGTTWSRTKARAGPLAVDPSNPVVVYAALQKSTDGGSTWASDSKGFTNTQVTSVAVDPAVPSNLYAVAGPNPAILGIGNTVFKSSDGAKHWARADTGLPDPVDNTTYSMVMDPTNPQILYVGTSDGVYVSTDAAASWHPTGLTREMVAGDAPPSLAVDPSDPDTIYAGMVAATAQDHWIYKTTDGGVTWTPADTGLPSLITVSAIAVDPSDGDTVYAAIGYQRVYKSVDGGVTWAPSSTGIPQGSSGAALAIDPAQPQTVYVGTSQITVGGHEQGRLYLSTDGGAGWTRVHLGVELPGNSTVDAIAILKDSPDTLYVGVTGYFFDAAPGVLRSMDGGTTWTLLDDGLSNPNVSSLSAVPDGSMVAAGTYGGGVFKLSG